MEQQLVSEVSVKPLEFRGAGGEYFGIWIVNLLLCIVTLGFYIPWARVRTRRYFHRNTFLDGHSFDYIADPKRLLIGYLVVGAFFIIYMASAAIDPLFALPVLLIFWAAYPWLRYKSLRFFASNTTYRNIRFRFEGTLGGAYAAYLGWPALAVVSLGTVAPLAIFKKQEYFFNHFAFGNFRPTFTGTMGWFFKVFYILMAIGLVVFVGGVMGLIALLMIGGTPPESGKPPAWFFAYLLVLYGGMFLLFGIWLVLSKNYCWNHVVVNPRAQQPAFENDRPVARYLSNVLSNMDRTAVTSGRAQQLAFESRIRVVRYLWVVFSNIVLTILTLGLYAPFAAVRVYEYRLNCLSVIGAASLDEVVAEASAEPNAMGDSAADLFDFEFGL